MAAIKSPRELLLQLRVFCVLIPSLLWLSYFWEKFSGVTFVFSKHTSELGHNSTPAHLEYVFEAAGIATLICVPLFYLVGIWMQQYPEQPPQPPPSPRPPGSRFSRKPRNNIRS